jgi:hypothetical protein
MVIKIHNHSTDTEIDYEGDRHTLQKLLFKLYPSLQGRYYYGDLEGMIDYIDSFQSRSVEIVDETEHPFLKLA